jgi:putative flippase GtrA
VGGGAVALDFISYYLLIWMQLLDPSWAKRCSFVIGAVWSFFANKFFTFKNKELKISQPVLFTAVYVSSFFLNSFIHDFVLTYLNWKLAAFGAATFVSVVWNYVGQKWLVFKKKNE